MSGPHRVVVVGGGFGGLHVARGLRRAPVAVTLVDRRNSHLFQPLLYQVATGALSPANIAAPLRSILSSQSNVTVLLGEAVDVDAGRKILKLADGEIAYDTLVVATGTRHAYFGHDEWEPFAPGLKTLEDATEMRRRILLAFEKAEREEDEAVRGALLTFVVVGGGPTGVELAGALGEIARHTLKNDFRRIDPGDARIFLVEAGPRILPTFAESLAAAAARSLERVGVTVKTGTVVTCVDASGVTLKRADASESVPARTVLWAAGVAGSKLAAAIAKATGAALDRSGRVAVGPDLTLPSHPEIFALGDAAFLTDEKGRPLPGVAQVAMQEGRYVARVIAARLAGKAAPPAFRYFDPGSMATIGRAAAIVDIRGFKLSGALAWLFWLFLHLMFLVKFGNRLLVFVQWAWNYFTWNRSARLITKDEGLSPAPE